LIPFLIETILLSILSNCPYSSTMQELKTAVPRTTRTGRVIKKPKRVGEVASDDDGEEQEVSSSSDVELCDHEDGLETSEDEDSEDGELGDSAPAATTTSTAASTTPYQGSTKGKHAREWEAVGYSISKSIISKLGRQGKCPDGACWDEEQRIKYCVGKFWTLEMKRLVVDATNSYAQSKIDQFQWAKAIVKKPLTLEEFDQYMGFRMVLGLVRSSHLSHVHSNAFPHNRTGMLSIGKSRGEFIASALHCEDDDPNVPKSSPKKPVGNATYTHEGVSKVGKLMEMFQNACLKNRDYTLPVALTLDEMMIRFQGSTYRVFKRQAKPTSMGMKIVAVTDYQGFLVCFMLEPGPGLGWPVSQMVINLCAKLPKHHVIYMDNLYTNVSTLEILAKMDIFACGTTRKTGGVPKETALNEKCAIHGEYKYCMREFSEGKAIIAVTWMDSGQAKFLSTAHGSEPATVRRKVKGQLERKITPCLELVRDYNDFMHGNDRADQMRTSYSIQTRACKWWKPIFNWVFDSALINAYLLYRQKFSNGVLRIDFMTSVCKMFCGVPSDRQRVKKEKSQAGEIKTSSLRGFELTGYGGNLSAVHFPAKTTMLHPDDAPKLSKGNCHVCEVLKRKCGNIRSELYCNGCSKYFHEECSQFYHLKTTIRLVDNKVVAT
jgi:hypothetical protein